MSQETLPQSRQPETPRILEPSFEEISMEFGQAEADPEEQAKLEARARGLTAKILARNVSRNEQGEAVAWDEETRYFIPDENKKYGQRVSPAYAQALGTLRESIGESADVKPVGLNTITPNSTENGIDQSTTEVKSVESNLDTPIGPTKIIQQKAAELAQQAGGVGVKAIKLGTTSVKQRAIKHLANRKAKQQKETGQQTSGQQSNQPPAETISGKVVELAKQTADTGKSLVKVGGKSLGKAVRNKINTHLGGQPQNTTESTPSTESAEPLASPTDEPASSTSSQTPKLGTEGIFAHSDAQWVVMPPSENQTRNDIDAETTQQLPATTEQPDSSAEQDDDNTADTIGGFEFTADDDTQTDEPADQAEATETSSEPPTEDQDWDTALEDGSDPIYGAEDIALTESVRFQRSSLKPKGMAKRIKAARERHLTGTNPAFEASLDKQVEEFWAVPGRDRAAALQAQTKSKESNKDSETAEESSRAKNIGRTILAKLIPAYEDNESFANWLNDQNTKAALSGRANLGDQVLRSLIGPTPIEVVTEKSKSPKTESQVQTRQRAKAMGQVALEGIIKGVKKVKEAQVKASAS